MQKNKRLAFYVDYKRFQSKEAPPVLFFIAYLRNIGFDVDFFVSEEDLLFALRQNINILNNANKLQNLDNKNYFKKYDVCLLSLMSADSLRSILQTAIKIKNIDPFIVNILGGTGVYGYYKELINAEGIDIVIEGDAEKTLPAVLDSIKTYDECGNYNKPYANIFRKFPDDAKSNIKKDEAYFCTDNHMELLFKNRGSFSSPISYIPDEIYFERTLNSLNPLNYNSSNLPDNLLSDRPHDLNSELISFKCPISDAAVKLNDGTVRYFNRINRSSPLFKKFYNPYKDLISETDFENLIAPHPTEEEINEQYTAYPWDIYDYYKFESIGIYAQRGCNWGKCSYCSIVNYNYRKLNIEFLLKILNEAKNHNVFGVSFDDDLFVQNKKWVNNFLDLIISNNLNERFSFTAMVKVEHIHDIDLLNKFKKANFLKIQIGVESFLPEKVRFFRKTKEGKELDYIEKAKEVIAYCASIGVTASSFIILTTPEKKFGLFDVINEIGEIVDILMNVYTKYKIMPIFGYNDFITAYPNAPLLKKHTYSNFMVAISGYITHNNTYLADEENNSISNNNILNKNIGKNIGYKKNSNNKNELNLLNLRTVKIPYMYKFYNYRTAHFIDALFKSYNKSNADAHANNDSIKTNVNTNADISLSKPKNAGFDLNIADNVNNNKNKNENKLTNRKGNNKHEQESDEQIMFLHTKKILDSLNNTFDMYGTSMFVIYEILDELESNINDNENGYAKDIIEKIFKEFFITNINNKNNISNDINNNYISDFKKLIASNKIEPDKALNIFNHFFKGIDYIKDSQKKQRDKGKEIVKILAKRLDSLEKLYNLNNK
ncbi:MAG: radical SAM protein [bacterium]